MKQIPDFLIKNNSQISTKRETLSYGDEYFSELYFDKEKLVFERRYNDNKEYQTLYYAYNEDEISKILINDENAHIVYEYFQNSHKIIEHKNFKNKIENDKTLSVENSARKCVCFTKFKLIDGNLSIVNTETDKNYYENDELIYVFEYNENGDCFMIHNNKELQDDIFYWEIGKPNIKFQWNDYEYYKTVEPIIPSQ